MTLREALAYYAKPRSYGTGQHSVFVDDTAIAKAALADVAPDQRAIAAKALYEYAQRTWGWGTDEMLDVFEAVDVVLAALGSSDGESAA